MDSRNGLNADWESLPTELLYLSFEKLDVLALIRCMFVCHNWNRAAQYVAEHKGLWKDIVSTYIIDSGTSFHLKSVDLTWRDCFMNHLMWNHTGKVTMSVKHVYYVPMIKNIHVYKNNLIVVHGNGITYYNIETGLIVRQIQTKCEDFEETNEFILKFSSTCRGQTSGTLNLYEKNHVDDFNIDRLNELEINSVVHYRVVGDCWYIINPWNSLILHKLNYVKHMARYYGSNCSTLGLTVHKDDIFVLLKRGDVMRATGYCGFEKMMDVRIPNSMMFNKMFHRLGIVFGVPKIRPFCFKRYDVIEREKDVKERVFLFECPDLACVTEHGEILIMGHNDGKIKIYSPRTVSEENVLLFEMQFPEISAPLENTDIIAVDVFEGKGRNHLFIATSCHIAHVVFDHKDMDDYLWSKYPLRVALQPDLPTV